MAYRRRARGRTFRRRRGRSSPWYSRKYNAMQLASAAWRGVRYIKGLVNSESYRVITSGDVNPTSSGTIVHYTSVAQGDGATTRTGNSIFVRALMVNLNIKINPSVIGSTFCRIIAFIDTQQIGDTSPSVTDVLESANVNSSLALNTSGRFKILRNWEFDLNAVNKPSRVIKKYFNLRHHVRYNGTNGSDIQKGGIYILYLSTEATNTPTIGSNNFIRYHDN